MAFNDMSPDREQGDFNSGLAIIYQLDTIEKALIKCTVDEDYKNHYKWLKAFWKTLSPVANTEERKEMTDYWKQCMESCAILENSIRKGEKSIDSKHILILDEWELKLRDLKQKKGMGMPKKKDARYALGN